MLPNSSQLDQVCELSLRKRGKWENGIYILIASGSQHQLKEIRRKKNMERKINVIEKQNADKDTSQLSVGKHIPHKPQSQSIYHTAVNPLCVCLCVHVRPYGMCVCVCVYQRGKEMQSVLNYWVEFSRAEGQQARGEKKHAWLKIDVFLLSASASAEISNIAEVIISTVNCIKTISHERINLDKYERRLKSAQAVHQNNTLDCLILLTKNRIIKR